MSQSALSPRPSPQNEPYPCLYRKPIMMEQKSELNNGLPQSWDRVTTAGESGRYHRFQRRCYILNFNRYPAFTHQPVLPLYLNAPNAITLLTTENKKYKTKNTKQQREGERIKL